MKRAKNCEFITQGYLTCPSSVHYPKHAWTPTLEVLNTGDVEKQVCSSTVIGSFSTFGTHLRGQMKDKIMNVLVVQIQGVPPSFGQELNKKNNSKVQIEKAKKFVNVCLQISLQFDESLKSCCSCFTI